MNAAVAMAHREFIAAQEEALKRVAVLLRDDYQARLAALRSRLNALVLSRPGSELVAIRVLGEQEE